MQGCALGASSSSFSRWSDSCPKIDFHKWGFGDRQGPQFLRSPVFTGTPTHRFPFPPLLILGGNLTALPGPRTGRPAASTTPLLFAIRTSSTRPFAIPNPGVTHPPQLHRNPCHANLPMFAPHFGFGHDRRPSSSPCASTGLIHDSGCRKMCAQGSADGSADGSR